MKRVEHDPWLHRFACFVAFGTFLLLIAGGLVTSTGSALAVPDWPLSYGMLFPPMIGGILYEHGHRLIAGSVGLLTIGLAVWLHLREPRLWVRRLGIAAIGVIVAQGLLGGMTVLLLLPPAVSTAHACLGQAFFCIAVTIALVTGRGWKETGRTPHRDSIPRTASPDSIASLGTLMTSLVFVQLTIGALMRHTGAGLAIPDFPLSLGRLVPPIGTPLVAIAFAHRIGALIVATCAAYTVLKVLMARRAGRANRAIARTALAIGLLVPVQVALGAATIWTARGVIPSTAHVVTGALILASSLLLTLQAARHEQVTGAREVRYAPPEAASIDVPGARA